MDPITIAMLATSALSTMQNMRNAKDQKNQREAAIRYSPWSKIPINEAEPANPYGDLAQGGMAALSYSQNKDLAASQKALKDAQTKAALAGAAGNVPNMGQGPTTEANPMNDIPYASPDFNNKLMQKPSQEFANGLADKDYWQKQLGGTGVEEQFADNAGMMVPVDMQIPTRSAAASSGASPYYWINRMQEKPNKAGMMKSDYWTSQLNR